MLLTLRWKLRQHRRLRWRHSVVLQLLGRLLLKRLLRLELLLLLLLLELLLLVLLPRPWGLLGR